MGTWIFLPMLMFAGLDWIASWRGWKKIRWLSKPGTLILLIAWYTQAGGWRGPLFLFGLGLGFSLLGDILLLLPSRFFLAGVAAFLLANLAYIAGFFQELSTLPWMVILPVLLVSGIFFFVNGRIRAGIREHGESKMLVPVMMYALILSLMWFSALTMLLQPDWYGLSAILVSIGAGLFFLSDTLLAYNRFVHPLPAGNLLVITCYHIGQILITAGVLSHFAF